MPPQSEAIAHIALKKKVIHSRLLEDKEICVINGTEDYPKENIQEILESHCAIIVEYPTSTTYCTIVGNTTTVRITSLCNSGLRNMRSWHANDALLYEIKIM